MQLIIWEIVIHAVLWFHNFETFLSRGRVVSSTDRDTDRIEMTSAKLSFRAYRFEALEKFFFASGFHEYPPLLRMDGIRSRFAFAFRFHDPRECAHFLHRCIVTRKTTLVNRTARSFTLRSNQKILKHVEKSQDVRRETFP